MKVRTLIEELQKFPADANARAYEGEVCGIVVETGRVSDSTYKQLGVIFAHESEPAELD